MYENFTLFYNNKDPNDLEKKVNRPVQIYSLINENEKENIGFYSLFFGDKKKDCKKNSLGKDVYEYNSLDEEVKEFEKMLLSKKATEE